MANILSQIGTAVAGKVSGLQSQIDSNDTDISSLQSDVSTAQSDITSNASDISTNSTNISTNASAIDTVEASAGLGSDGSYSANSSTNYLTGVSTLKAADEALDSQVKVNADDISTNGSNISSLQSDMSTAQSDITSNDSDISDLQTQAGSLAADGNSASFSGNLSAADLTLSGDLTVQGTTTAIETTSLEVTDAMVLTAKGSAGANDSGVLVDCGGTNKFMGWNAGTSKFEFLETDATSTSTDVDGGTHSGADVEVGALYIGANVLGEYSDFSSALG